MSKIKIVFILLIGYGLYKSYIAFTNFEIGVSDRIVKLDEATDFERQDDVIALIAQDDINVGLYSEDDLQIDAALVAQNGRVGRYFYPTQTVYWIFYVNACTPYDVRSELTLNGTIITNERYGFAYDGGNGYQIRNLNYDANLLYSPPPSFPLTSDQYEILKWREVE